ncbi:MAG: ABC transporter permease [Chthoniobacterales bacterium]
MSDKSSVIKKGANSPSPSRNFSWRRLRALCRKEFLQVIRDPSSNVIAFILPVVLLFIFGYGINLDSTKIRLGLVSEDMSSEARRFADSLIGSPYLDIVNYPTRNAVERAITDGNIRGFIVISQDFSEKMKQRSATAPLQVVADGAEPNMANFVEGYTMGAWQTWQQERADDRGENPDPLISIEPRFWFNPSAESRNYLIPGSITIIMTVIGALLTALVIAREWERGTMEALLASPITTTEFLLSKLIPYYVIGISSLFLCTGVATFLLGVPYRGSPWMLFIVGTFFLLSVLGMGLAISTVNRSQFNAAQAALNAAFLPGMLLSGFIFEVGSMPWPIRIVTYFIPARYFVDAIQTLFQAGDIMAVLIPDILFLMAASIFFLGITARNTRRRME